MKTTQLSLFKWCLLLFAVMYTAKIYAQTDVTDTYLTNASFDTSPNILVSATGNLGTDNTGTNTKAVTGWTVTGADWRAASTFEYGTATTLNGQPVPALASDGTTTGSGHGVLGISVAWAGNIYYKQSVTLPAGTYKFTYKFYNSYSSSTGGSSKAGWVPNSGTSSLSTKTSFPYGVWTSDEITFALTEETAGTIQLGVVSSGSGSGGNARVFIDDLKLEYTAAIADADDDGIPDSQDNCVSDSNADQADHDNDNVGNVCDADYAEDSQCFTQLYPSETNIVKDPNMNNISNFGGWGTRSIITDPAYSYCGNNSGLQGGGSLDYVLTGSLKTSTAYRLSAMVNATSTAAKIGVYGWSNGAADIIHYPTKTGEWEKIDYVFTTGATLGGSYGMFYNSASGSYIDNWELYEIPNYEAGLYGITLSTGSLNETFAEGTITYSATLQAGTTAVTPSVTKIDPSATVSGLDEVDLTSGTGSSTIVVTARDGSTQKTYTVNYTVEEGLSDDATLQALSIDAGVLLGKFDSGTFTYEALIPAGVSSVNITAVTTNGSASISSGDGAVNVSSGNTSTEVVVLAQDGTTSITYTINFTVSETNYMFGWDGNGHTGIGESKATNFGWESTSADIPWNDANQSGGARFRDGLTSFTDEDGGAVNEGRQFMFRWDGGAYNTAAYTYPVHLAANTVYEFSMDYVLGGSGTPPGEITVGLGKTNDNTEIVHSVTMTTTNSSSVYRNGVFVFMTEEEGTYYMTFTGTWAWYGVTNLKVVNSQLIGWNGTVWSNNSGPVSGDDVFIQADMAIEDDLEIGGLYIGAGTVTVDQESTFTVNSDLLNYGSLIIESGSSLITMDGNDIDNNIVIKRNTRYADGKYSFVGTPVAADASITGASLGMHVYKYNETTAFGADGINRWENASADELVPGKGYTQANQMEISFTGTPNAGTITFSGTYTQDAADANEGWNLVANPYAAAISVTSFLSDNSNTTGAIYLWDDNGSDQERGSNSDYIVANGSGATSNSNAGNGSRFNTNIGSAQAFFVQLTDGASTDVVFNESQRVAGNNSDDNFFRTTSETEARLRLNLTSADGLFKQALIAWNSSVSDAQINKMYDAPVFNINSDYSVYTFKLGNPFAIQTVTNAVNVIPVGFNVAEDGLYTLSVDASEFGAAIYLHDKLTNTFVDITKESYSFQASAGKVSDRFELTNSATILGTKPNVDWNVFASENVLHIQPAKGAAARTFSVYSLSGQFVMKSEVSQAVNITLNVKPGVYIITDGLNAQKFIIK